MKKLLFILGLTCSLSLFYSFSFTKERANLKVELRDYKGDTTQKCDCNVESRYMKLVVRIWPPKTTFQFDKVHIDMVKDGPFKYVRERNGDAYISLTKKEMEVAMNGKDYFDVELDYYSFCEYKKGNMYIMLFGDLITGYKKTEESNRKVVKTPVYTGGNGKELGRSKLFLITEKTS